MYRILLRIVFVLAVTLLVAILARVASAQVTMAGVVGYSPVLYQQLLSQTVTITIASPGVVTLANHGFVANQEVQFANSGGNLPTGIVAGTTYFVIPVSSSTFQVAATANGAAINTSGTQAGTQSVQPISLGIPAGGARMAIMCAETQNIRWRDDGPVPTATVGMLLVTGGIYACMVYSGNLSSFNFIPAAAGGILDVSYYR